MRPWHVISPLKRATVPERIIVFAVEPKVKNHPGAVQEHTFGTASAIACYLRRGKVVDELSTTINRPAQLWDFIDAFRSKSGSTWVFAHNLGYSLCLLGFWDQLDAGGDTLVSCVLTDPPTIITTRRNGRLIRYVDTNNYWRDTLCATHAVAASSESAGRVTMDGNRTRGHSAANRARGIADRLLGLITTLAQHGAGSWAATAAGVAWNVYRHSFLRHPIVVHGNERCLHLERAALYGGRLESFSSGHISAPVTAVDVNSLYPSVMATHSHPWKLIAYFAEPQLRNLHDALRGYHALATVTLSPEHPPVPTRGNQGTSYTQAAARTTLSHHELLLARDAACIAAVHELAVFDVADLFSGYISYLYPRKVCAQEMGDVHSADFYKLCLNSLSGKFAQKGQVWHDDAKATAPDRYIEWWGQEPVSGRPCRYRAIAGHCQRNGSGPEPRHTCPAITAGITSAGRVALGSGISLAGKHNVHYCDTDSLHVNSDGRCRLDRAGVISPAGLGRWKVVISGPDAHYWGPKHYRVGDWWVCNYLTATAVEVANGTFLQDSYCGIGTQLATGLVDRVVVQERTIQLPAGTWDQRRRLHQGIQDHECREYRAQESCNTSSSVSSMW